MSRVPGGWMLEDKIRIVAEPARALVDEVVDVRVTGLQPRTQVELRSVTEDEAGVSWESRASFKASNDGAVDLRTATPIHGSWRHPDPMAFLWAMQALNRNGVGRYSQPELRPAAVALSVIVEADIAAVGSLERFFVDPRVRQTDIRTDGLVATLFEPDHHGPNRKPAVMVLGGSLGGLETARAALLASHGFPALALAYFGVSPLPTSLVDIPLEYFGTAFKFLENTGLGARGRIAVMGTSRGAELALLLASRHPTIGGVVAYVPSGIVHYGIPQGGDKTRLPGDSDPSIRPFAWTENGNGLRGGAMAFDRVDFSQPSVSFTPGYREGLKDIAATSAARIPLREFEGPVAMFSGADDQVWPSPEMAAIAERELVSSSHVENVVYSGAGHNIGHPYLPTTVRAVPHPLNPFSIALGGSNHADAVANADSWRRSLRLLNSI
jgi:dienelactone hydrolase